MHLVMVFTVSLTCMTIDSLNFSKSAASLPGQPLMRLSAHALMPSSSTNTSWLGMSDFIHLPAGTVGLAEVAWSNSIAISILSLDWALHIKTGLIVLALGPFLGGGTISGDKNISAGGAVFPVNAAKLSWEDCCIFLRTLGVFCKASAGGEFACSNYLDPRAGGGLATHANVFTPDVKACTPSSFALTFALVDLFPSLLVTKEDLVESTQSC